MSSSDDVLNEFPGLDEPQFLEILDPFESELAVLVIKNHELTLKAIEGFEDEGVGEISEELAGTEPTFINAEIRRFEDHCDDLRKTVNRQALVSLVTRLEHWSRRYEEQMLKILPTAEPSKDVKDRSKVRSWLWCRLEALNAGLGKAPIDNEYFDELAKVRNSIIHGDSQAEWQDDSSGKPKPRSIPARYTNCYKEVEFTADDLKEAIEKSKQQMGFYDVSLCKLSRKP